MLLTVGAEFDPQLAGELRQERLQVCGHRGLFKSCSTVAQRSRGLHADLGRVDVDHPPDHRSTENLPERLCCLEAVAGRERHPPLGDLLRGQLTDPPIPEDCDRFVEQRTSASLQAATSRS